MWLPIPTSFDRLIDTDALCHQFPRPPLLDHLDAHIDRCQRPSFIHPQSAVGTMGSHDHTASPGKADGIADEAAEPQSMRRRDLGIV